MRGLFPEKLSNRQWRYVITYSVNITSMNPPNYIIVIITYSILLSDKLYMQAAKDQFISAGFLYVPQSSSSGIVTPSVPSLATITNLPSSLSAPISSLPVVPASHQSRHITALPTASSEVFSTPLPTTPPVTGHELSTLTVAVPVGAAAGVVLLFIIIAVITAVW